LKLSLVEKLPLGERLARAASQTNRDIVFIIDGSYSMDCRWQNTTAHESAKEWVSRFLNDLGAGDRVAILQAKQQSIPVQGLLSGDLNEARLNLAKMPMPRGGVAWDKAVQEAYRILDDGKNPQKEIIILTDGQRYGWADSKSLLNWQSLAEWAAQESSKPRLWVVNAVPDRPDDLPNWFVSPITSNRSVATVGREVRFRFNLESSAPNRQAQAGKQSPDGIEAPKKVLFKIDEEPAGEKELPRLREPSIGMEFKRSFGTTGSHLFSASIGDDALPGDNEADYAVDVLPAIPVLIVDGDRAGSTVPRGSDFIRYAIAPAHHPQPSFLVQTISVQELASTSLHNPVTRDQWSVPRVLILQNVPMLSEAQHKSVEEFLNRGGGVLVALGQRCQPETWNANGYREGQGWLPARIVAAAGDETDAAKDLHPAAEGIDKSFLEMFKEAQPESFLKSTFGRWWKLAPDAPTAGNIIAVLTNRDPLLIEKPFGGGRVLLSATPLDDSWRTTFLHSHDFVRLCHETLYYLAGSRFADVNLEAGQEIYFRPGDGEPPGGVTLRSPTGEQQRFDVAAWPFVFGDTRETGVYKLSTDSGKAQYYVVQPDYRESNLTGCSEDDHQAVASLFSESGFLYENDRARILQAIRLNNNDPELWWLFLLLLIGLLTVETAFTRALAKKNPPALEV
jgi:hypothetical protein